MRSFVDSMLKKRELIDNGAIDLQPKEYTEEINEILLFVFHHKNRTVYHNDIINTIICRHGDNQFLKERYKLALQEAIYLDLLIAMRDIPNGLFYDVTKKTITIIRRHENYLMYKRYEKEKQRKEKNTNQLKYLEVITIIVCTSITLNFTGLTW